MKKEIHSVGMESGLAFRLRPLRLLLAQMLCVSLLVAPGLVWAEALTWDAKQTFSENTTLADDVVLVGEVEIEVSRGTLTLGGAVTGEGSIRKTGAGMLVLAHSGNTFAPASGAAISVDEGILQADAPGAFGSGAVSCGWQGIVRLNADGATFPNDMTFSGRDSEPCQLLFVKGARIAGNVAVDGEAGGSGLWVDAGTTTIKTGMVAKFTGSVNVGDGMICLATVEDYAFNGPLTCGTLFLNLKNSHSGRQGKATLGSSDNSIGLISMNGSSLSAAAEGALGGARYFVRECQVGASSQELQLGGYSQSVRALDFGAGIQIGDGATYARLSTSSGSPVLTVTGDGESAVTRCWFPNANVQLKMAVDVAKYPAFVQTFSGPLNPNAASGRANKTAQPLDVASGTLRLDNDVKFAAVPSILIGEAGVLQLGAITNALTGVSKISCAGRIEISESANAPFADNKVALELAVTGKLAIPQGMTLMMKSLAVGGVRKSKGFYDASSLDQIEGEGQIYTDGDPVSVSDATWTAGAGTDTSVGAAANWGGTLPGLSSFETRATFATSGTEAVIDRAVRFQKLTLDAPNGFALRYGANGSLSIGADGLTVAAKPEETDASLAYAIEPPVALYDVQTWTIPADRTLTFGNGFSNADGAFVSVVGGGSLVWRGTNTLAATVAFTNVPLTVVDGTIASVNHEWEGEIKSLDSSDRIMEVSMNAVTLANGRIEKTIRFRKSIGNGKPMVVSKAWTTNEIAGFVRQADNDMTGFMVEDGSELTLSGGYMCSSTLTSKFGPGTLRIRSRNFGGEGGTLGFVSHDGLLVFEDGGTLSSTSSSKWMVLGSADGSTASVEFLSDVACRGSRLGLGVYVSNNYLYDRNEGIGTAAFHATAQEVHQIVCAPLGVLTGEAGSVLRVVGNQDNDTNLRCASGIRGEVNGGLSIEMGGTGTLTLSGRDFASAGELSVTDGTLELAADASWANGGGVSVGGNGTLVLARGRGQLSPVAAVRFSGGGKLKIGGLAKIGSLAVYDADSDTWMNMPKGDYNSKSTGAMAGRIVSGTLRIGTFGTVIVVR